MKRINLILIAILMLYILSGCSDHPNLLINDSQSAEAFVDFENSSVPNESIEEKIKDEVFESGIISTNENKTQSSIVETRSKPTPPINNSQSTNSSKPEQQPIASSQSDKSPEPTKPVYTESDYNEIIRIVREYGESKGFIWDDSFTFEEGHQYYGRPNLERDEYDGTISMLKYHCDKIEMQYGICCFKVVKHLYMGYTEFVVLYD